jgi:dihydrofolate reductase
MVSSLDGFIAKHDNSISWLRDSGKVYEAGVSISEEEAAAFVKAIDCYVLGSRTYAHALELGWPYGDTPAVVVSGREWPSARKSVEFYSGDLKTLVDVKLAPRYRNIWLVGGHAVPAFSPTRPSGRNQVNDGACPVGRRPPAIRWFPNGAEVELEKCGRLQERLC